MGVGKTFVASLQTSRVKYRQGSFIATVVGPAYHSEHKESTKHRKGTEHTVC